MEAESLKEYVRAENNLGRIQEVRVEAEKLLIQDVDNKNKTFLNEIDEQNRTHFEEFTAKWDIRL